MLSRLCSRKLLGTGYHEAREGGKPTTEFSVTEIFPAQNYAFFFQGSKTETQRLNMARNIYNEIFKNKNLLSLKSTLIGNYYLFVSQKNSIS